MTGKTASEQRSLYTAIHVKKDGKWKISELLRIALPALRPRERLEELGWLIGEWEETDKADDLAMRSQYLWARGGNFLTRNVTVKRGGTRDSRRLADHRLGPDRGASPFVDLRWRGRFRGGLLHPRWRPLAAA